MAETRALPEGYSLRVEGNSKWSVSRLQPCYHGEPITDGWYMAEDDAVGACWGNYYKRRVEAYNDKAEQIYSLVWGYRIYTNGDTLHAECLKRHYSAVERLPLTYGDEGDPLLLYSCGECGEELVTYEEADELFFDADTHNPEYESDMAQQISNYAESVNSSAQIDGYRAGLCDYPTSRGKAPREYAAWLGYTAHLYSQWLYGYADGVRDAETLESN